MKTIDPSSEEFLYVTDEMAHEWLYETNELIHFQMSIELVSHYEELRTLLLDEEDR